MKEAYAALANRVHTTLQDLERVVNRAEFLLAQAQTKQDDGYLDGVALNLHGFYAGVETIFEDIARTVDGALPTGSDWHRMLLIQMAGETEAIRPSVIESTTRQCLEEYRAFRHIVRNVYTFNLRPSRLRELTEGLHGCYSAVQHDLEHFVHFLQDVT